MKLQLSTKTVTLDTESAMISLPSTGWLLHNTEVLIDRNISADSIRKRVLEQHQNKAVRKIIKHREDRKRPSRWFDKFR